MTFKIYNANEEDKIVERKERQKKEGTKEGERNRKMGKERLKKNPRKELIPKCFVAFYTITIGWSQICNHSFQEALINYTLCRAHKGKAS